MKKISLIILFLNTIGLLSAQNAGESVMQSSGKIYVVVGIILIIFALIVLYLFRIDKKISKLEKNNK